MATATRAQSQAQPATQAQPQQAGQPSVNQVVGACVTALERAAIQRTQQLGIQFDQQTGALLNPPSAEEVTPVHSTVVPSFSVVAYAQRLAVYTGYGAEGMLFGLVLIARAMRRGVDVTLLTVHRMLLVALAVAMKANADLFYKNVYIAQTGGVTLGDLNRMEKWLLTLLHFSVMITREELNGLWTTVPQALVNGGDLYEALCGVAADVRPVCAPDPTGGADDDDDDDAVEASA